MLVSNDPPCLVFAGDLAAFPVEGVAVAVSRGIAELAGNVLVFLEPAQLFVAWNVAPDEIAANTVPGGSLSPERTGVKPDDRRIADLGGEPWIELDDVWLRIAYRLSIGTEIPGKRVWRHRRRGGNGSCCLHQVTARHRRR
ncbi:hypothetical protein [Fodinicurvata halophila]|uniref:hypothetical protein n=1 Tax=Fodinicurvata halophila TaxID=1419723 RepID=UPI00363DBB1D